MLLLTTTPNLIDYDNNINIQDNSELVFNFIFEGYNTPSNAIAGYTRTTQGLSNKRQWFYTTTTKY